MRGYTVKKSKQYYAVVYEGIDPTTGKERRRWIPAGPRRGDAERLVTDLVKHGACRLRFDPWPTGERRYPWRLSACGVDECSRESDADRGDLVWVDGEGEGALSHGNGLAAPCAEQVVQERHCAHSDATSDGMTPQVARRGAEFGRRGRLHDPVHVGCVLVAEPIHPVVNEAVADLVLLASSIAARPATSTVMVRSSVGSRDVMVIGAWSTSAASRPSTLRAACGPCGVMRALRRPPGGATASGTMRSTGTMIGSPSMVTNAVQMPG